MKNCCHPDGPELPIGEFGKYKNSPSGLSPRCKECNKTNAKRLRDKDKCITRKKAKEYREKNKEKISKYRKEYRLKNYDRIIKQERNIANKNRGRINEAARKRYKRDRKGKRLNQNMSSAVKKGVSVIIPVLRVMVLIGILRPGIKTVISVKDSLKNFCKIATMPNS